MTNTIVVCGYGGGISDAVARKFGGKGFRVALVARNRDRLAAGAKALEAEGMTAKGFACDLANAKAVDELIADVRQSLGPITVLHWNAYAALAGDLLTCAIEDLRQVFDVAITGMLVATQACLEDMRQRENAAILVTGGGFALNDPNIDAMAVQYDSMGLGLAKAAQHKLAGLLNKRLASEKIFVGEVMVMGSVKGTAFDQGQASLEPASIAEKFWEMYEQRSTSFVQVA